jgi:hypothetical protein
MIILYHLEPDQPPIQRAIAPHHEPIFLTIIMVGMAAYRHDRNLLIPQKLAQANTAGLPMPRPIPDLRKSGSL